MPTIASPFRWSTVAVPVLFPAILFGVAEGAILPVIPVLAEDAGASLALAGVIAAMIMVGELAGALPSGWLVGRIRERTAMIGAAGIIAVGAGIALWVPGPVALAAGLFVFGLGGAVFALARHAFMTVAVPMRLRARALSTLGGSWRIGMLIGPLVAAALLALGAEAHATLLVGIGVAAVIIVVLLVAPDPEGAARSAERPTRGVMATAVATRRVLGTIGVGAAILAGLRAVRNLILPLWAAWAGIDPALAALIIGLGAGIDVALFFLGGWLMDRFGRRSTAAPAIAGLAVSNLVLAVGIAQPAPLPWFLGATLVMALANGVSAGVLMTLGADLADPAHPAAFLAVWRLENQLGAVGLPLAVAGITGIATIGLATGVTAVIGLIGTAILWRWTAPDRLAAAVTSAAARPQTTAADP